MVCALCCSVPIMLYFDVKAPLVGRSPHHVKNTQDFIDQIKGIHLGKDQCMMLYDVKALFTSVPIPKAITIIKQLLKEDQEL